MSKINLNFMRTSGKILSEALIEVSKAAVPGVSSLDLSKVAEEVILSYKGAFPAFKGYHGFPETACVSVNYEVVHTIPKKETILREGDIVSFDCGVIYSGHYTDACRTLAVGNISPSTSKLLKVTEESLNKGIDAAVVGNRISDISYAIQRHVEKQGLEVNLDFTGHGIGLALHLPPPVPNYGPPGRGLELKPGMCLAIEPVVFDGSPAVRLLEDNWTIVSSKKVLSAHFEDTIIITDSGPEIITR